MDILIVYKVSWILDYMIRRCISYLSQYISGLNFMKSLNFISVR